MTKPLKASPIKASGKLRLAIYDYLKTVIIPAPEEGDGFCSYVSGHSDKTVADHFQTTVTIVAATRKMGFGNLRDARPKKAERLGHDRSLDALLNRMTLAELELDNLRERVERLEKLFKVPA